jgi:hypothetical protein
VYVLLLELSDQGRFAGLVLKAELSPAAERRLRIRRQERTTSNTRVGLVVERGTSNNDNFQELNHLNVKLNALRPSGTVEKIMTLAAFIEKMTKK